MSKPLLSVLIPCYNEEGNIEPLLTEVHEALQGLAYEIICVDDGSKDATAAELETERQKAPEHVITLHHIKQTGKSAALMTGLKSARGQWVQLIDGDGQNLPADIRSTWDDIIAPDGHFDPPPKLGLIAGRRTSRNDGRFKWLQSRIANGIRRFCLNDDTTDVGCGFKMIRTETFKDLPYFGAMHRFLPALVKRTEWQVVERPVTDRERLHGQSKYGFLQRLGAGFVDLLGMMWLMRRGPVGIAKEWDDPRAED